MCCDLLLVCDISAGLTAQYNAPINVFPHHPLLGRKWGFTGGIDTKLLPHYGAFDDRSVSAQIFFVVTSFAMSNPELIPRCNWGQRWGFDTIGLPYYGAFDIRLCQIPTIAPYMPEGGVVGQYIDRCINNKINICNILGKHLWCHPSNLDELGKNNQGLIQELA